MYFKPCLYMVIGYAGGNTRIVYELQARLIFLYVLPVTMPANNSQFVNSPITSRYPN